MRWEEALKIKQNWTAEQARNDLERLIITGERPADKVVGLACQALEKQIPKKPTYKFKIGVSTATGNIYKGKCCECGHEVEQKGWTTQTFCDNCGQALDWSDAE